MGCRLKRRRLKSMAFLGEPLVIACLRLRKKPGRSTVFTDRKKKETDCQQTVAEWGYPLIVMDFRLVIKGYLNKQGREKRFRNNVPGVDFIRISICIRVSLSLFGFHSKFLSEERETKRARSAVDHADTISIMVQTGTKRVERVQEHSKMTTSVMVCGNAAGGLPPMIIC